MKKLFFILFFGLTLSATALAYEVNSDKYFLKESVYFKENDLISFAINYETKKFELVNSDIVYDIVRYDVLRNPEKYVLKIFATDEFGKPVNIRVTISKDGMFIEFNYPELTNIRRKLA